MRKKILKWFLIIFVLVFLFNSFTSDAAADGFDFYPEYWLCDGNYYPYYRFQSFTCQTKSNETLAYYFDKPVYGFGYRNDDSIVLYFVCDEPFTYFTKNITTQVQGSTINVKFASNYGCAYIRVSSAVYVNVDIPLFDGSNLPTNFIAKFCEYFTSDIFVPIYPLVSIPPDGNLNDSNFALFNPRAQVQDGVLTATWQTSALTYWPSNYVDMPLLVDIVITDKDTNQRIYTSYPARSSLPDADRLTVFDVEDFKLSFSLAKIENLPTNFTIDYIVLTPYYRKELLALDGYSVYKGQSSMILLGIDGYFDGVIQILPDVPIPDIEPDEDLGLFALISNFFSGFFNNLKNLFKDLFIPSSSDMQILLEDMQEFFSEKFGFLWYPFDQAIQIVDAFSSGTADSEFQIPACTLNLGPGIGTVTMWNEQSVDLDPIGIAQYVRFFTSAIICCSVAMLAWKKFDEVFKGAPLS